MYPKPSTLNPERCARPWAAAHDNAGAAECIVQHVKLNGADPVKDTNVPRKRLGGAG